MLSVCINLHDHLQEKIPNFPKSTIIAD